MISKPNSPSRDLDRAQASSKTDRSRHFLAKWFAWSLCIGCMGASTAVGQAPANAFDQELQNAFQSKWAPLLEKHCSQCHSQELREAEVDVTQYRDLASVRAQPALWDQIRGLVKIGAMPPEDADPLTDQDKQELADWIDKALHQADCGVAQSPGHVTVRRLNSKEYDRTVRDLLQLDVWPSQEIGFPSDDVGNGFDNQGEVLSLPPLVMEKYLQAAEWISKKAIVIDEKSLRQQSADGDDIAVGESCLAEFDFAEGEYNIDLRLRYGDGQQHSVSVKLFIDDQLFARFEVEPKGKNYPFTIRFSEGTHRLRVLLDEDLQQETPTPPQKKLHVERFRMEGPANGSPRFPASHRRVIAKEWQEGDSFEAVVDENLRKFLPIAFRRPVTEEELLPFRAIALAARDQGLPFRESMQVALQAILVAPDFLFRIEQQEGALVREGVRELSDWELASRLSYFLWSSMPDDALRDEAQQGTLSNPDRLIAQVHRMLDDPKADALVDGFFEQWLGLRNLQTLEVDNNTDPLWNDRLRAAMRKETQLFCRELLSREGKLSDILLADFTFVNPRMAELYGLPFDGRDPQEMYRGPKFRRSDRRLGSYAEEERWIKTSLPPERRGLLTQAAILTLTSNPSRTSPVKRGKWVLENILGDPPPAAPPNVPTLEATQEDHKGLSLREQLEIHRSNPSCASCHRVMDPIGLGLENFNAIGRFRTEDAGKPIVASGELADGRTFSSAVQLSETLAEDQPKLVAHFCSKLLTYALGRGLVTADQCALGKIETYTLDRQSTVRSVIEAIVLSEPFRWTEVAPPTSELAGAGPNP
jgi:cytochrome c553